MEPNRYEENFKNGKLKRVFFLGDNFMLHNENGPAVVMYSNTGKIIKEHFYNTGVLQKSLLY
jgi:antitoxin component YwqK of YwqJK toxin-antitoxin module